MPARENARQSVRLGAIVQRAHPQINLNFSLVKLSTETTGDGGDQYVGLDRFGRLTDLRYLNPTTIAFLERLKFGYDRNSNRLYKDNQLNNDFDELYHPNAAAANEAYDPLNRLKSYARGQLTDSNSDGRPDTIRRPPHQPCKCDCVAHLL